jgi:hypothetical protein
MATKRTDKPPVPEDDGPPEIEGVAFLTPQEARARFDQEAHRVLGISGAEFVRRWEGGEYAADPERVMELVVLLPMAR